MNAMIHPHEVALIKIRNAAREFVKQGDENGAARWRAGLVIIEEYASEQLRWLSAEPKTRVAGK